MDRRWSRGPGRSRAAITSSSGSPSVERTRRAQVLVAEGRDAVIAHAVHLFWQRSPGELGLSDGEASGDAGRA
jgi:hypothetical protein